jgi:hypothetical protein
VPAPGNGWVRRALVLLAVAAVACRGADGSIERHGSGGPGKIDSGPASNGEYGNDPGEADARQDFVPMPPDDPDGGLEEDASPVGDAAGEEAVLSLGQAPARIAHLACQRRLDCCLPAERSGLPDEAAACEQELADELGPSIDAFARSVAGGRATYDGAALTRCLASFQAAPCAEARRWEPLLAASRCAFLVAALPAGGACRGSYECRDGFCQGADPSRDGRCVSPRLPDGQPCDRGEDCASGACHPLLDVCAAPEPGNLCD